MSSPYETPLTKVRVSLAEVMPLLGERFMGVCSSLFALVPFSCGGKMVNKHENRHLIEVRLEKVFLASPWARCGFPSGADSAGSGTRHEICSQQQSLQTRNCYLDQFLWAEVVSFLRGLTTLPRLSVTAG